MCGIQWDFKNGYERTISEQMTGFGGFDGSAIDAIDASDHCLLSRATIACRSVRCGSSDPLPITAFLFTDLMASNNILLWFYIHIK